MKRRGVDYKSRKFVRKHKFPEINSVIHYFKLVTGWVILITLDSLLGARIEFMWSVWVCVNLYFNCLETQGLACLMVLVSFTMLSDLVVYCFLPMNLLFFVASTYIWVYYIWNFEKGTLQLPSMVFIMIVTYIEISVRFMNASQIPLRALLFKPLAAHSVTFSIILGLNIGSLFTSSKKKTGSNSEFPDWLSASNECCENSCKQDCGYSSIVESKNNQKKQWDKSDLNNSANSTDNMNYSNTNTGANGGSTTKDTSEINEKLISERIQSVNEFNANNKEKDCGKSNKNCAVPLKSNSNYKDSNSQNIMNAQKDKKNKSNRDCNVSQNTTHKEDYYQRLEAQLKKAKLDVQINQQVEVNLRNQINSLTQESKNTKHELYKAHKQNEELQSKLHNLVTTKQADRQNIINLEKKLVEEKKQRNSLDNQLQNLKKTYKKNDELNKTECTECCRMRRTNLETENKRLKKELKEKDELYCTARREVDTLCNYKEKLKDVPLLISKMSAMKEQNARLEHSLRSETRIKLDLFSALGEVKRQLDIREKLIKGQESEIGKLQYALSQLTKHNQTALSSLSNLTLSIEDKEFPSSLLDSNIAMYMPTSYMKSHLSLGT